MSTITITGTVMQQPQYAVDSMRVGHLLITVAERLPSGQLGTHFHVDAAGVLADNAVESVLQGDSLIVTGELSVVQMPATGHIVVALVANHLGHDLAEVRSKRVI